jgi:hypothetical protein
VDKNVEKLSAFADTKSEKADNPSEIEKEFHGIKEKKM